MENWIKELLINLDNFVDEKTVKKILEKCGTKCPFSHMPDDKILEMKKNVKSEKELLDHLCRIWRLKKENNRYFVVFDQCYCPLVNKELDNSKKSMCNCTLGSLKKKFKILLERNVEIKMLTSILKGNKECRFEIMV